MRRCIPTKSVHLSRPIPWIDSDIRCDIRLRERLYKCFKSSKCFDWYVKYKSIRNQVVSKLREAKLVPFQNLASTWCDSIKILAHHAHSEFQYIQPFHGVIKWFCHHQLQTQIKLWCLTLFFASCFNSKVVHPTYVAPTIPVALPPNLDITPDEVIWRLRKIKPHSASGPDAISTWILRTFAEEPAPSIASLFNLSLKLGRLN